MHTEISVGLIRVNKSIAGAEQWIIVEFIDIHLCLYAMKIPIQFLVVLDQTDKLLSL